jgi:hypothetical protein
MSKSNRKATHTGHCQICGREHKINVNNGRIANHGYSIELGFFMGSCFGSGGLPIEISSDLIKQGISENNDFINDSNKLIKQLTNSQNRTVYIGETFNRTHVYGKGQLSQVGDDFIITFPEYSNHNYKYPTGKKVDLLFEGLHGKDIGIISTSLNQEYVNRIGRQIVAATDHGEFMQSRLDSWKPGKLTAIDQVDFIPDPIEASKPLSNREQKLLDLIKNNEGCMFNDEATRKLGLHKNTRATGRVASGLKKRGLITVERAGCYTVYELTTK